MITYDTVVEALNGLRSRGFTIDFNIAFDKLMCHRTGICLNPSEFDIVEVYRFEGDTNPSDEDAVYAISSSDGKVKGVIMTAFGTYADSISADMLKKLSMHS